MGLWMSLECKVALITGASSGIIRATEIELAKNGVDVVINYFHSQDGAESFNPFK